MATGKRKALFVAFEKIPWHRGISCWMMEEIKALAPHFELDVLSIKDGDMPHLERFRGARMLRVPVGNGPILSQFKAFQRAVQRQMESDDYQLCHYHSIWEGVWLNSVKETHSLRLVYEIHSLPSMDFGSVYPLEAAAVNDWIPLESAERACLAAADRVIVGSRTLKKQLLQQGVSRIRVVLAPPSIDLATLEPSDEPDKPAGAVFYLGDLKPWHGISSLLNATERLSRRMSFRLIFQVEPSDPWHRELKGKIEMLGLSNVVEFLPPVSIDRLAPTIGRATVCVAPYSNHPHNTSGVAVPHKLLTYMGYGRPVVATDQPVIREIMLDGEHGMIVQPGDAGALADAIQCMLINRKESARMGEQARQHIKKHFDLNTSLRRIIDLYDQLLKGPAGEVEEGSQSAATGLSSEAETAITQINFDPLIFEKEDTLPGDPPSDREITVIVRPQEEMDTMPKISQPKDSKI